MTKQQRKLYMGLIKRLCDLYDEYFDCPFSAKEERQIYHIKVLKVFEEIDKVQDRIIESNLMDAKPMAIIKPVSLFE